jgi:UDPglucose 6-dehydrogenase
MDVDARKIDALRTGTIPIYEPGLKELVERNLREGRLNFTTDMRQAIRAAQLIFVAVGTPQAQDGSADLSSLWALGRSLAECIESKQVVVIKSTVPVGTSRKFAKLLVDHSRQPIEVVSNPEFLKEGAAIDDFMKPDRVVVGTDKASTAELLRQLYAPFLRTEQPFLSMSPESAEMTKYAANAMLATKISFINEIANFCERMGADINDVRRGIGHDTRIGFQFLFPGAGFGGSCFPKDVRALICASRQNQVPLQLMEAVDRVNEAQKRVLFEKISRHYGDRLKEQTLAIWGIAFKPRTDDIREAPALVLIDALLEAGAALRVHDPEAMANVKPLYKDRLIYCDRPYGALEGADGLVLATEWQEFRHPDFEIMRRLMRQRVIFDGRNVYEPKTVAELGFKYYGIGRSAATVRQSD